MLRLLAIYGSSVLHYGALMGDGERELKGARAGEPLYAGNFYKYKIFIDGFTTPDERISLSYRRVRRFLLCQK